MLISIIIPVYNVAQYVAQCIQSVIDQTYQHLEVIVVDDCGTDDSMSVVEKVLKANAFYPTADGLFTSAQRSQTFRILHHASNRGLSAARNTGIEAASGEYLYFLDSDDLIVSECMEQLVTCLDRHPDSQLVFAGSKATSPYYEWLEYDKKPLPDYSDDRDWLQLSMLRRFVFGMTAWNKLISRQFILEHHLRFVEGLVHEDEVWNFEISQYIQSASFLKSNVYIYNFHSNSIVTSHTEEIHWERLQKVWQGLLARIGGRKKSWQVRAIADFILQSTKDKYISQHRLSLCWLFFRLSIHTVGRLSVLLVLQGFITLCCPSRYSDSFIAHHIGL